MGVALPLHGHIINKKGVLSLGVWLPSGIMHVYLGSIYMSCYSVALSLREALLGSYSHKKITSIPSSWSMDAPQSNAVAFWCYLILLLFYDDAVPGSYGWGKTKEFCKGYSLLSHVFSLNWFRCILVTSPYPPLLILSAVYPCLHPHHKFPFCVSPHPPSAWTLNFEPPFECLDLL